MTDDDDLSDVIPSDKFKAEFPDGNVPIIYAEHLFWSDNNRYDTLQALVDTTTIYDEARRVLGKVDAVAADMLLKEYRAIRAAKELQGPRTRLLVRELVLTGLRIGPLLNAIERWVFDSAFKGEIVTMPHDKLCGFDDDILSGMNYRDAGIKWKVSTHCARMWSICRGFDHDTPFAEAVSLWGTTDNNAEMLRDVMKRYPYMHLDYSQTYRLWKEQQLGVKRDRSAGRSGSQGDLAVPHAGTD